MKITHVELTQQEWTDQYEPAFEFYGEDIFDYPISTVSDAQAWTLIEQDGTRFLMSGIRYVNRMGYVYTSRAVAPDVVITVILETERED